MVLGFSSIENQDDRDLVRLGKLKIQACKQMAVNIPPRSRTTPRMMSPTIVITLMEANMNSASPYTPEINACQQYISALIVQY